MSSQYKSRGFELHVNTIGNSTRNLLFFLTINEHKKSSPYNAHKNPSSPLVVTSPLLPCLKVGLGQGTMRKARHNFSLNSSNQGYSPSFFPCLPLFS